MKSLTEAASAIHAFQKDDLGESIAAIETLLRDSGPRKLRAAYPLLGIDVSLLDAALAFKAAAAQVNVIIHAVGILLAVPKILDSDERVQTLSLGAGSTGIPFDLETTKRVAEFKFIHWKGGSEAIRQNSLFKDFYLLAEHPTTKRKELYVIGTEHPLRFLSGGRALSSVMSRNNKLWSDFQRKYPQKFSVVSDYYTFRKAEVHIRSLLELLPALAQAPAQEEAEDTT